MARMEQRSGPLLVAITGGTASGKSTLAERLVARLGHLQPLVVHQDQYFRDWAPEERERMTRNAPEAVRWELLRADLARLAAGETIGPPPPRRDRPGLSAEPRSPGRLVIVEGHLLLVDERVRALCPLKVYLDVPDEERVIRRLLRDTRVKGPEALAGATAWYRKDVLPNHERHTAPTRLLADLVIPAAPVTDVAFEVVVAALESLTRPR